MEILMIWIVAAILAGIIAANKGRNTFGWVMLTLLLSPLAVLVLLALPSLTEQQAKAAVQADSKTCPACAESVKRKALVCRYCSHEFEAGAPPVAANGAPASPSP